jgi:hypothetical protein
MDERDYMLVMALRDLSEALRKVESCEAGKIYPDTEDVLREIREQLRRLITRLDRDVVAAIDRARAMPTD